MKLPRWLYLFLRPADRKLLEQYRKSVASMPKDIREAHDHCNYNRPEISRSKICGCFYCLRIFEPKDIVEWINNGREEFAMCPHCGIDSVFGDVSGFPISRVFLEEMNKYWFDADALK